MDAKENKYNQMMFTPIPKLIIGMSIATISSQLVSTIYNMADSYFVAQLGTQVTGAVGIVNSLQSLIQALGYGIGMGAGALISRNLGKKDINKSNIIASTAMLMSVISGIVLVVIGLPDIRGFMRILGATETMLEYCVDYGTIILLAAPIMCPAFVSTCIIRYQGFINIATIGLVSGCIANTIMDPIFIWVCHMGVAGAALSTAVSELLSLAIMLSFMFSKKTIVKISVKDISRGVDTYFEIIKSGLPTIFRQMMGSVSSALLNNCTKPFGDSAIAAVTISNKIYALVRNLVLGVGQAMQPVVGFCYGAGNKERVKKVFNFSTIYGTIITIIFAILLTLFGTQVVSLFQKDDPQIMIMGVDGLRYCCIVLPLLSFSTFVNQLYQVLGFAKHASLLASCRQGIFFVPIVLILPKLIGVAGIEMTQAASDFATFIISIPFLIVMYRYLDGKIQLK